ncbi:UvrABC system C protein [Rhynchospora pubera]|uniref:UvrABC system C protein n=1 Tax=Rhynchospora pubera TaxID=906938 RepID=A0AAV8H3D0_9POAL|nr:UvrABC system C protein [Rhynchospora pubera]
MAGGNFLGRVMSYIVNEIVVEGLANNLSFQRFAVKTNKTIQELSNKAAQAKEEILEQVKEASRNSDVSQIHSNLHFVVLQNLITCLQPLQIMEI